jgi:hypothetical protein
VRPVDGAPMVRKAQLVSIDQRAILYEEDPANANGNRFSGSVSWQTQTELDTSGHTRELFIRADIDVPERHVAATMSVRRNTDRSLPASHVVELMFAIPADYPFGGISSAASDDEENRAGSRYHTRRTHRQGSADVLPRGPIFGKCRVKQQIAQGVALVRHSDHLHRRSSRYSGGGKGHAGRSGLRRSVQSLGAIVSLTSESKTQCNRNSAPSPVSGGFGAG